MQYFRTHFYAANPKHYDRFLQENEDAISTIHTLIERAIKIFNGESEELGGVSLVRALQDTKFNLFGENAGEGQTKTIEYIASLFPEAQLEAINKEFVKNRYKFNYFRHVSESYSIQLFGMIKLGEHGKSTLQDEIETSHAFSYIGGTDGTSNKLMFDVRSAICVGLDLGYKKSMERTLNSLAEGNRIMFEVSNVLIRFMSTERYYKNQDIFNEAIIDSMVSRLILLSLNRGKMMEILADVGIFEEGDNPEKHPIGNRTTLDIGGALKCLIIYKFIYESVNGLSTFTVGKGIEDVLDYLTIATRDGSMLNCLTNAFHVLVRPSVAADQHSTKYIDSLMEDFIDRVDKAKRYRIDVAPYASYQAGGGIIATNRIQTGFESALEETYLDNAIQPKINIENIKEFDLLKEEIFETVSNIVEKDEMDEFIKRELNDPAIIAFEGLESRDNIDVGRKTRGELLGQLKPNLSSKYRKLEAEAIKLKADCINCNDVNTQSVILRKVSAFIRILGINRNQYSYDEVFTELIDILDDDMYAIRNALSERNFFQERNSRLYGVARADLRY